MEQNNWRDLFAPATSPYFACYTAGRRGVPLSEVEMRAHEVGILLREKDVKNWEAGWNNRNVFKNSSLHEFLNLNKKTYVTRQKKSLTWSDLPEYSKYWKGTDVCYFPCSELNKPMCKWGYSIDYMPILYTRLQAYNLSPIGWVARNLYGLPICVLDIDGVGHGSIDKNVIAFGSQFKNMTQCWEDPARLGSFHLVFQCRKVIHTNHYPHAHIDVLGNFNNQAQYFKNRKDNGIPPAEMTREIYESISCYEMGRR